MRLIPVIFLVAVTACEESTPVGGPPDAAPDQRQTDVGDVTAPDLVADALVDAGHCAQALVCEPNHRHVGPDCACVSMFDRSCFTDADCRVDESCREVEGVSICWYEPPPALVCPGSEGCSDADGPLLGAAAVAVITPDGYETAPAGAITTDNTVAFDPNNFGPGDWNDCGYDALCPGDDGYPGPDEGEADGVPQGAWLAGFENGRPAQHCPAALIGCPMVECCVSALAHDELQARVAVLRQGETTVALVAVDTVGLFYPDIQSIRAAVSASVDLDLLVVAATHNHEAPDTMGQWGPGEPAPLLNGRDPRFIDRIVSQTAGAIEAAIADLEPVDVEAMSLNVGVDGLAASDSRPPYIIDDHVPVVRLTSSATGKPLATLLSYANHPEVLWSNNPYITADYPGFVRDYIERGLPSTLATDGSTRAALAGLGGVTVFFSGALGGLINPGRGGAKNYAGEEFDDHTYAAADAVGQQLASRVLSAVDDGRLERVAAPSLSFARKRVLISVENRQFHLAALVLGLLERDVFNAAQNGLRFEPGFPDILTEVAVVRLGPITFFTAPGEVFPELMVGGYPGRPRVRDPVVGDAEERRTPATCDADGLQDANGTMPCIVSADQENPPDWSAAPAGPYVYDRVPGAHPFLVGLGFDSMGYIVPPYDFEEAGYLQQAPGSHYEETNSPGPTLADTWINALQLCIDALEP